MTFSRECRTCGSLAPTEAIVNPPLLALLGGTDGALLPLGTQRGVR